MDQVITDNETLELLSASLVLTLSITKHRWQQTIRADPPRDKLSLDKMNNTKARRESLGALMANGEACILFANQAQNLRNFSQDNNFLYFTGLNIPNAILLLIKNADAMQDAVY